MSNKPLKMILLHGAGGTKDKWRSVLPLLANEAAVAIDLPGHGENSIDAQTSIEAYANELAEEITEDCVVVGHSMGGLIALELAGKLDNVKAVVLIASSYELPVHSKIIESLANGVFPEFLFKASYGTGASSALLMEELAQVNAFPTEISKMDFQACADYKMGDKTLKEIKQPVLAVIGEEDKLVPKDTDQSLRLINSNVTVQIIPNAGHYSLLETPEKVADALVEFKKSVEATRR